MLRPRIDAGLSFIFAGALASSVAVHRCIETLGRRPLETTIFGSYQHVAVLPAIVATVVLSLSALLAFVRQRRCAVTLGAADPMVREAKGVVRIAPVVLFGLVLALQLGLLYVMESAEQLVAFGHVAGAAQFLGDDLFVAALANVALAVAATFVLRKGSRQLVAACDRALRLLDAFVRSLRPLLAHASCVPAFAAPEASPATASLVVHCFGLRAPPIFGFIAR